ncbi:MAG: HAMP domain-containing sensor histidine kinase, partial [Planctomycetota bacterium]
MSRKVVRAVFWFDLKEFGFPIALPCPSQDLLDLYLQIAPSAFDPLWDLSTPYQRLLVSNPSALILASVLYQHQNGVQPENFQPLVNFCEKNFHRCLADIPVSNGNGNPIVRVLEVQSLLDQYLNAKTPKSLRKILSEFLSQIGCVEKKKHGQRILRKLFAKSFNLPLRLPFENSTVEISVRSACRWSSSESSSFDLCQLFQVHEQQIQFNLGTETRLRDMKLESMKGLAYGASHEINNPLANISTRAQTLLRNEDRPENRYQLSVIYEQALRAHEMISDLMLFANPPALRCEILDLNQQAKEAIHDFKIELNRKEIKVTVLEYPDVVPVEFDSTQLKILYQALLKNSIEAIGDKGEIKIRLFRESVG